MQRVYNKLSVAIHLHVGLYLFLNNLDYEAPHIAKTFNSVKFFGLQFTSLSVKCSLAKMICLNEDENLNTREQFNRENCTG